MQADPVSLLGRDDVMAEAIGVVEALRYGHGGVCFIEGEPGIGKSRVVTELVSRARSDGVAVAMAAATEFERNRPFGPLLDAFAIDRTAADEPRRRVARLVKPEAPDVDVVNVSQGPGRQYQAVASFVDLVEAVVAERPLLLALEDLHWSEASTAIVIHSLARRLDTFPVAIVLTFRSAARHSALEQLVDVLGQQSIHIRLEPLSEMAVSTLVATLIDGKPGPALRRVVERAGGNPLYIIELVHGLQEAGALEPTGATIDVASGHDDLPLTLATTILRRVRAVPADVFDLLRSASILGSTFAVADLAAISGRPVVSLLPPLEAAGQAGVVDASGEKVVFRHPLVHDALYQSIPAAIRLGLHRDAGHALASTGAPAVQVAEHLTLGAAVDDPMAFEWLVRAGRETVARAPAAAVGLFERALAVRGISAADRASILPELIVSEVWCGHAEAGARLAESALRTGSDGDAAVRIRAALVQALWLQGRWQAALDVALKRCAEANVRAAERARLLAESASALLYGQGPTPAEAQARQALAIGESIGDDVTICLALWALALCLYFEARYADAVAAAERAVAVAQASARDEARRRHPHFVLGQAYVGADRLEEGARTYSAGRAIGAELGTAWDAGWYQAASAGRAFFAGEWDDAVAEAEAAVSMAADARTLLGQAYSLSILGLIALHRDQIEEAEQHCAAAEAVLMAGGMQIGSDWVPWLRALLTDAAGDAARAFELLQQSAVGFEANGMATSLLRIGPDVIRLGLRAGDRSFAERIARRCAASVVQGTTMTARGTALRCQGLVDADPSVLLEAATVLRRSPRVVERAAALEDAASALGASGAAPESSALFREALGLYGGLAAARDEARTLGAMRSLGLRVGVRGRRRRPTIGWGSLTKTELAVVRLVAEGQSNPQIAARLFISRHTVETHLRHVFGKLDVRSRAQVAAEAARRGHPQGQNPGDP